MQLFLPHQSDAQTNLASNPANGGGIEVASIVVLRFAGWRLRGGARGIAAARVVSMSVGRHDTTAIFDFWDLLPGVDGYASAFSKFA